MKELAIYSIIVLVATFGWVSSSFGQAVSAPLEELRIVDKHPYNWMWITLNVFEHLMEFDKNGKLVPRLATSWRWLDDHTLEVKLRQSVKFHNGEIFDAEIVKLNWEENIRLRQPHIVGEFMNFKPGARLKIIDPQTARFIFPEPDGGVLTKLAFMHIGNRQFYRELGWGEKHW